MLPRGFHRKSFVPRIFCTIIHLKSSTIVSVTGMFNVMLDVYCLVGIALQVSLFWHTVQSMWNIALTCPRKLACSKKC